MYTTTYLSATDFLARTQHLLEKEEVINSLMLGTCLRQKAHPEKIKTQPYLATVEEENGLALAAMMTPPHKLVLYSPRESYREAVENLGHNLLENNWKLPGVLAAKGLAETFVEAWTKLSNCSCKAGLQERVFKLTEVTPPQAVPGYLRTASEADLELVVEWTYAFMVEAQQHGTLEEAQSLAKAKIADGTAYLWEAAGKPVSLAGKTRPTTNGITIGPVYTPPLQRGHGYASACVATLSQLLLDEGWKFCTLFTDLANPTSNSIYQKMGYKAVCDFNEYIFDN